MNDKNLSELRQYAWKYFEYHASQRLTTFHFYIILSTLLASGYFIALRYMPIFSILFSCLLVIFSFVFKKLDSRNKQLIHNSEDALKYIESQDIIKDEVKPHVLNIFLYEELQTKQMQAQFSRYSLKKIFTFSTCFGIVFYVFGIMGFFALLFSVIFILS